MPTEINVCLKNIYIMVYSNTMLSRHLATLYLSLAPIIRNARKNIIISV